MSIRFSESLACTRPFGFAVRVERADGSGVGIERDLDVLVRVLLAVSLLPIRAHRRLFRPRAQCKEEKIEVAFSRAVVTTPGIIGTSVTLKLINVTDVALNPVVGDVSWQFSIAQFDEQAATVTLSDVRVPVSSGGASIDNKAILAALFGEGAPLSQISVRHICVGISVPSI